MPEGDSLHRVARRLQVLVGERVEAESPNPRGRRPASRAPSTAGCSSAWTRSERTCCCIRGRRCRAEPSAHERALACRPRGVRRARGRRGSSFAARTGRRRSGTARSSRWAAVGAARSGRICSRPGRIRPTLVTRLRRVDQSRLLGEALVDQRVVAGSGTCGSRKPGTPASHPGGLSQTSRTTIWRRGSPWACKHMRCRPREPVAAVGLSAGRRPCPRCGTPGVSSRGLGDMRTAYWCSACQPSGATA